MILETGQTKWLGLGVVFGDYGTTSMPGWAQGTVGYHTDDRSIFDADYCEHDKYKKTTGRVEVRLIFQWGLYFRRCMNCPYQKKWGVCELAVIRG